MRFGEVSATDAYGSTSQGFGALQAQIMGIDNGKALVVDQNGRQLQVRVDYMTGSGATPQIGEIWWIGKANGLYTFQSRIKSVPPTIDLSDPASIGRALIQLGFATEGEPIPPPPGPGTVELISASGGSVSLGSCALGQDWLTGLLPHWRAKRDAAIAGSRLTSVTFFGDSITQGYSASDELRLSHVGIVSSALTALADGGSGFQSIVNSRAGQVNASVPAYIDTVGNWAQLRDYPHIPNGMFIAPSGTIGPLTHGLTFHDVRGRYIDIWHCFAAPGVSASFGYSIDHGTPVQVTVPTYPGSGAQYTAITIDTHSNGIHRVDLATNASNSGFFPLGVTGRNATGIIVNNMGLWGRSMGSGATCIANSLLAADLTVLALSTNDITSTEDVPTFTSYAQMCANAIVSTGSDLLVVLHNIGAASTVGRMNDFETALQTLATGYNGAYYDLWSRGGRTTGFMVSQGYINVGDEHPNSVNTVNPANPSGHAWVAGPIIDYLKA